MKLILCLLALLVTCSGDWVSQKVETDRIVGGTISHISVRPYQVSIRRRGLLSMSNDFRHSCGGSIYDENFIITAAHCVISAIPSQLAVIAGTSYRTGTSGVISPVREIIFNQDFEPDSYNNDIALLVLKTPLPINNFTIKPIELADKEYPTGTAAIVSGWGALRSGGSSPYQILEVSVPLISFEKCYSAYSKINTTVTDSMICAGVSGKDACQGDSGGPLVTDNKLIGVVSWGFGCAFPGFPGVYYKVIALKPWIIKTIEDAKIRYNLN